MKGFLILKFDDFLAAARERHGERFQYDRSVWTKSTGSVRIKCSAHGWFEQAAHQHLRFSGCPACGPRERVERQLRASWAKFIAAAQAKHRGQFRYDRRTWRGMNEKVGVYCAEHGWLYQVAFDHLKFGGCHLCQRKAMSKRLLAKSWPRFFVQAQKKYGDRFEYDASSWSGVKTKLRIRCEEHGWFEQVAFDHLRLNGCRHCSAKDRGQAIRLTENELRRRFHEIHGDRYGYDRLDYAGLRKKVTIRCGVHGDFKQSPESHLRGDGCQRCSGRHRWTTEEFIENSIRAHPDRFTYERTKYRGALNPVTITCKIHGDFTTQPSRHITKKHGCAKCSPSSEKSLAHFLSAARQKFGDRYDYSFVEYVDTKTPVKIVCRVHGMFEQPPKWHLKNSVGCRQCSYNVSSKETTWLDSLDLPGTATRQGKIKTLDGRRRNVDAVCHKSKRVWEFWGDWWHGHPKFFPADGVHPKCKKAYGQLFKETQDKRRAIRKAGYKLVEIWEHQFDRMVAAGKIPPPRKQMAKSA